MKTLTSLILSLTMSSSLLHGADDIRPVLATELAPGPYQFSLDLANLLEAAASSKPTSLWWDSDCQAQRNYATSQIRLMTSMTSEMPPVIELLESGRGGFLIGYDQTPEMNIRDPLFVFLADMGDSNKAWHEWLGNQINRRDKQATQNQAGVLNGYSGFYEKADPARRQQSAFFGFKENNMLVAMVQAIRDPGTGIDTDNIPQAPASLTVDGSKMFEQMKFISENAQWDPFNFKDWGFLVDGMKPKLHISITPRPQGWEGEIHLEGLGDYQFNPVSDAILKSIPQGSLAWFVEHIDVKNIVSKITPSFSKNDKAQLQAMLGADLDNVAAWLDGNIAFAFKPAAIIPEMTLTLGITDSAAVAQTLSKSLAPFTQATALEGSTHSWMVMGGMPMIIYVGVAEGRLVVSNNSQNITAILTGQNLTDTSAAAGKVAFTWMDIPGIAQIYLPMVWGFIMSAEEKLARNKLDVVRWDIRNAFQQQRDQDLIDKTTMDNALKELWRRERLEVLFQPETDLTENFLNSFSVWKSADVEAPLQVFVRTQHGYRDLGNWNNNTYSLEEVEGLIGNNNKFSGPDINQLPVILVEDPPMFNKHWVPPLAKVIQHLPVYESSCVVAGDGKLVITEKGFPLMSLTAGFMASAAWFETADRYASAVKQQARQVQEKAVVPVEEDIKVEEKLDDF